MAATYSGAGVARLKLYHPLNTKDGDEVGPGSYTLEDAATIQSATAQFGSALKTTSGFDRMVSDSAIAGADISDNAKILMHFFWRTPSLGVETTFGGYMDSGETDHKWRFTRESSLGFFFRWHRNSDFSPLNETIQLLGSEDTISLNTWHSIVGFLDANSVTQGKIFVDGVDKTTGVSAIDFRPFVATTGFDRVYLGNFEDSAFSVPARFMDEVSIIQGAFLSDTKVAALVAQYDAVRGFGHRPIFSDFFPTADGQPGDSVVLIGSGFGLDVAVRLGGIDVDNLVRVSESRLEFDIPVGIEVESAVDLEIENVLAEVTLTVTEAYTIDCDLERLQLILRGALGGDSHPLAKLILVDDDGTDIVISEDVISIDVIQRRDDRRTDTALLAPPTATIRVMLRNIDKRYTTGAGGIFDGKLTIGRVVKVRLGYFVDALKCLFPKGEFILDDPGFEIAPGAIATIQGRDKLSLALDKKISMRSFAGRADEYIQEVLEKVGILPSELVFPETVLTFVTTTLRGNQKAIDVISDMLLRLQTEDRFRLIQVDDKIKLVVVPQTGLADVVFHFRNDMSPSYRRVERSNQARVATTIKKDSSPTIISTDVSLDTDTGTEATFTGTPKRRTLTFSEAIRIEWRQLEADDLRIKEVSRTTTSITFGLITESDTGSYDVRVRGDTTSAVVGEAGPGIDQGGVGLGMVDADGNELNMLQIRRGKTFEQRNVYIDNDSQAQALANELQIQLGPPVREVQLGLAFADPRRKLNELFRVVEKYSDDKSLYHIGEIRYSFRAEGARLTMVIVGQHARIQEEDQKYDKAFGYDDGRIYDERFPVGEKDQEDTSFRGAVVTRPRP